MGIRGPLSKSPSLTVLTGNPGKRAPGSRAPQPGTPLERPSFLSGEAAEIWSQVTGAMPNGTYTAADVPVLAIYCQACALWRAAQQVLVVEGLSAPGSRGQLAPHPAVAIAARQADLILKAADRLGLSPVARTRLEDCGALPPSKFAGLLGGAARLTSGDFADPS
jgi:P27 family predicted phage terminase small subunit